MTGRINNIDVKLSDEDLANYQDIPSSPRLRAMKRIPRGYKASRGTRSDRTVVAQEKLRKKLLEKPGTESENNSYQGVMSRLPQQSLVPNGGHIGGMIHQPPIVPIDKYAIHLDWQKNGKRPQKARLYDVNRNGKKRNNIAYPQKGGYILSHLRNTIVEQPNASVSVPYTIHP